MQFRWKNFRWCRQFSCTLISPHVWESGFRNQGNFCMWNPESWALESGIQLKESIISLTIAIPFPSSTNKDRNKVSEIRNPRREIQNPTLFRLTLHRATYWCPQQFSCSLWHEDIICIKMSVGNVNS